MSDWASATTTEFPMRSKARPAARTTRFTAWSTGTSFMWIEMRPVVTPGPVMMLRLPFSARILSTLGR